MARFLIVSDIHLSDRAPSSCTDDYLDDLFAILEQTVELESTLACQGTIWAGDVFHHKQPSRTSYRTMLRTIDIVRRYKQLWIVPGNHDMLNDRLDSVETTQPLGVLFHAGARLLDGWASVPGESPPPIYGVPWQQEWTEERVEAAFTAWHKPERNYPDRAHALVVTHAPLYPPGLELEFEYYPTRDEDSVIGEEDFTDGRPGWASIQGAGYCYYGHIHEAHGIYTVPTFVDGRGEGAVTFANHGAIARGSLHEYNLTREVAVTCWDSDKGFAKVPVNHKPAAEVFRLVEAEQIKDNTAALEEFLASIGSTTLEITSTESVVEHIRTLELPEGVAALAIELLEAAS